MAVNGTGGGSERIIRKPDKYSCLARSQTTSMSREHTDAVFDQAITAVAHCCAAQLGADRHPGSAVHLPSERPWLHQADFDSVAIAEPI
jgi:hypothetical protein